MMRRVGAVAAPRAPGVILRGPLACLVLLAVGACDDDPLIPPVPPRVVSVGAPEMGATVGRGLTVELDQPARVAVEWGTPGGPTYRAETVGAARAHTFDLVRMHARSEYRVVVGVVGFEPTDTLTAHTDSLPSHLAALDLRATGTATSPLTMLEITVPDLAGSPIVVDDRGRIVWFREGSEEDIHGVGPLPGGGFAINTTDGVSIVGLDGSTVARLTEADAAARTGLGAFEVHHDVIAYGPTSVLLLVEDTATVEGAVWTGEAIWTWDWASDDLRKRWTAHDHFVPSTHSGPRSWTGDWLHGNSLSVGPRGNVLVSMFWTHEVVSIAHDFASVEWTLGGPESSFVVADGAMDAGQHTAVEVTEDRVLLFDNGLDRPGGAQYSRAIELALDRTAGTADVAWMYRPTPDIYAPIVSSARRLDSGNTLVAFGTARDFGGLPATGPVAVHEVRSDGTVAWTLSVGGAALLYRATPLAGLGAEVVVASGR